MWRTSFYYQSHCSIKPNKQDRASLFFSSDEVTQSQCFEIRVYQGIWIILIEFLFHAEMNFCTMVANISYSSVARLTQYDNVAALQSCFFWLALNQLHFISPATRWQNKLEHVLTSINTPRKTTFLSIQKMINLHIIYRLQRMIFIWVFMVWWTGRLTWWSMAVPADTDHSLYSNIR